MSSKTTTDHDTIQQWAEARDGRPATVDRTASEQEPGVLRIIFPQDGHSESDNKLHEIPWGQWFEKFDDADLALLYQEKTEDGNLSKFNKLVAR